MFSKLELLGVRVAELESILDEQKGEIDKLRTVVVEQERTIQIKTSALEDYVKRLSDATRTEERMQETINALASQVQEQALTIDSLSQRTTRDEYIAELEGIIEDWNNIYKSSQDMNSTYEEQVQAQALYEKMEAAEKELAQQKRTNNTLLNVIDHYNKLTSANTKQYNRLLQEYNKNGVKE